MSFANKTSRRHDRNFYSITASIRAQSGTRTRWPGLNGVPGPDLILKGNAVRPLRGTYFRLGRSAPITENRIDADQRPGQACDAKRIATFSIQEHTHEESPCRF